MSQPTPPDPLRDPRRDPAKLARAAQARREVAQRQARQASWVSSRTTAVGIGATAAMFVFVGLAAANQQEASSEPSASTTAAVAMTRASDEMRADDSGWGAPERAPSSGGWGDASSSDAGSGGS